MTTTTTDTTTTYTDVAPVRHRRLLRFGAVAGAALAVATIGIVVATDDTEPVERPTQLSDQQRAAALAEVAEWARTHQMTGLSPLSLTPVDQGTSTAARRAAVDAELARIAIQEGLTGLSPLSLHPIDDD